MVPAVPDLMGCTLAQRYTLRSRIGSGGMGTVYKAIDAHSGAYVAIKVLNREAPATSRVSKRFKREMHVLRRMDHANLIRVLDDGKTDDDRLWFAMELVTGWTLSRHIRDQPLPADELEAILRQILQALGALHDADLVHRDLKAGNVMVSPSEGGLHVTVLDLGVVASAADNPDWTELTAQGVVVGTPEYMSPESIYTSSVDGRSDLYALGILSFQMATGRVPWRNSEARIVLHAHLHSDVPDLTEARGSDLPPHLHDTIYALLQKRVQHRPQDVDQVVHLLNGGTLLPPEANTPPVVVPWLALIAGGLALVMLLLSLLLVLS